MRRLLRQTVSLNKHIALGMPVEEARWPDYVTDPVASFRSATENYIRIDQLDVVILTVNVSSQVESLTPKFRF